MMQVMNRDGKTSIWLILAIVIATAAVFTLWQGGATPSQNGNEENASSASVESSSSSTAQQIARRETACGDRVDDDRDGYMDCDDSDCASSPLCGCAARSCGDPNRPDKSEFSCFPAEGCFCDSAGGCRQCRTRGDTCTDSTECCGGGMNLICDSVTLASGAIEKRCVTPTP